jgi:hypothetical protein
LLVLDVARWVFAALLLPVALMGLVGRFEPLALKGDRRHGDTEAGTRSKPVFPVDRAPTILFFCFSYSLWPPLCSLRFSHL